VILSLGIQTVASTKDRSKGLFNKSQVPYVDVWEPVAFLAFNNFLPVLPLVPEIFVGLGFSVCKLNIVLLSFV